MDKECKVSVIIPIYNSEKYLHECLNSILRQTLDEIEIICVDDGSEDNSREIVKQHASKDERIHLIMQEHKGVSAARNTGMQNACGQYLYFIDSDDLLDAGALSAIYSRAERDTLDITFFNGRAYTSDGDFRGTVAEQNSFMHREGQYKGVYKGEKLMDAFYNNGEYWMVVWLQLYRREFLESKGLKFEEGIIHEDNLFTFITILSAERCGYVDRTLYKKRVRPGSITTAPTSFKNVSGYFACYLKMIDFIINKKGLGSGTPEILMAKMLEEARRLYSLLPADEKKQFLSLSYKERLLFKSVIIDYSERNESGGAFVSSDIEEYREEKSSIKLRGFLRNLLDSIRRLCHKILPSSRHNVAWSYHHLTVQLQIQQQLLNQALSSNIKLETAVRELRETSNERYLILIENNQRQMDELAKTQLSMQDHRNLYQVNNDRLSEELKALWTSFESHKFETNHNHNVLKKNMGWIMAYTASRLSKRQGGKATFSGPAISLIIPVFNNEKTIEQCMESVLEQTLGNMEIICVDDGSSDASLSIIRNYRQKDQRIKIIEQSNKGSGHARNKAIEEAEGEYIAFMDADDYYPNPYALNLLFECGAAHSAYICGGSVCFIQAGEEQCSLIDGIDYSFRSFGWIPYEELQQDYYFQRFIFKRQFLIDEKISFKEYRRYQDVIFLFEAMLRAGKIYAIPIDTYTYRIKDNDNMFSIETGKDVLMAITAELKESAKKNLRLLHYRILYRLPQYLKWISSYEGRKEMKDIHCLLQELKNAIDEDIARNNGILEAPGIIDGYLQTKDMYQNGGNLL